MTNTDTQIATILDRYGEPVTGNVWQTEGETFIHHKTLERIAGKAKITFDPPTILRTGRDEAVLRLCCMDQGSGRNARSLVWGQVTRI